MTNGNLAEYESDDCDGITLKIISGGNGDYYLAVLPKNHRILVPAVRICTSGGAASKNPRVMLAVAELYRALLADE